MNKDKQNAALCKLLFDFLSQNLSEKLMPPEQSTGQYRAGYYTTYFERCAIIYIPLVLWQNSVHILYYFFTGIDK